MKVWKSKALRAARPFVASMMLLGVIASAPAQAQDFKEGQAIKIVVPYGAGGPTDVVARLLQPHISNALKRPVIVENRAGAGSAIGARAVAAAAPDGHTILLGNISTYAIAPATMKNPGYDPTRSLAPIVQTSDMSAIMVTQPNFPANDIREFIAYAKANPGKISYGSAGIGNSAHLLGELLAAKAGINMVHIPYKSGAEMALAVLSGQVQLAFNDLSAAIGGIRDGKLKALAVTGLTRSADFPDLPTMIEVGYPDIVLRNWTGAAAPAGTPPALVKKLESAINEGLKSPDYQAAMKKMGGDAKPGTSEEFGVLVAAEFKKWTEVGKAFGISLD